MMKKWGLYSLGILFARLYLEDGDVMIEKLDGETGNYLPGQLLTEEDNQYYQEVTYFDLTKQMKNMDQYHEAFSQNSEEVILPAGDRYLKADADNYVQRDIRFPKNVLFCDGKVRAFTCPSRERIYVLVEEGYESRTILGKWEEAYPDTKIHPLKKPEVCSVKTRDGELLSTVVLLPAEVKEPAPAILVRTPYGKEREIPFYERYVHRGYAVVIQDVRGRNDSTGEWIPNHHETEDGDDTLNWIAEQPWSSGKAGMIGGSYLGYVQWAAAASGNPHLCAIVSVMCAGTAFVDLPRKGGAFVSGMMAWAFSVSRQKFNPGLMVQDNWDELLDIRPLENISKQALGYEIPFFNEWIRHMEYDGFWEKGDWVRRSQGRQIPSVIMSGWFDDNGMGTTEAIDLTKDHPADVRKVILGPWPHGGNSRYDVHNFPLGNDALKMDIDLTFLQWFDRHLKGEENGVEKMPPVQYYTLGDNQWKTAQQWPIPNSEPFSFYLTSDGHANTSEGDGRLALNSVDKNGVDELCYDPENPAIYVIDMSENEAGVPENYTEQDRREDILCYTTEILKEDLTLTGDFTVELFVSSDAPDTDFVVRINDVDEMGTSIKLADGVLSARFRNGFSRSEFMEPGKVYKIAIRTSKLSNTFKQGHRLRLTVTSGAKNLIFPNSNTEAGYTGTEIKNAHNRIHHGADYPSRVICRKEI